MNVESKDQESQAESTPEFDGGSFTIDLLSDKTAGFEFRTRNSLRRRQGKYGLRDNPPGGLTPLPLTPEQREKVTTGMKREVAFVKRRARLSDKNPHEYTNSGREKYMDNFRESTKVGVRNVSQEGNIIKADTVFVPFPFLQNIRDVSDSPESIELADPAPTTMILESSDGKLIIQLRSKTGNSLYGGVLGASAAGHFDNPGGPHEPGTLPEITTESIKQNAIKEMGEEIGLAPDDVNDVRITGLSTDKLVVHKEFMLFGRSNLTAGRIEEKAEENAKSKNPDDDFDFDEKFFVINGDPVSIRTLLTQVHCPLPPTHAAAFAAAWFSQMLEKMSPEEAKAELKTLEEDVKRNYKEIDLIVRASIPGSNGYDAAKLPEEQGLPDIVSELRRTGLLEYDKDMETETTVPRAWLFDVDGVINSPGNKTDIKEELVQEFVNRLEKGEPVVFITGRATDWFEKWVLPLIKNGVSNESLMPNFYFSGEFGNVSLFFEDGELKREVEEENSVPQDILDEAKKLTEDEFSDSMSVNNAETFHSTEINDKVDFDTFKTRQKEVARAYQELLNRHGNPEGIIVHEDLMGTNILHAGMGKASGTASVIEWLEKRGIKPDKFVAFGDSSADIGIGQELSDQGLEFDFVFVGENAPENVPFQLIQPKEKFDRGTLGFLKTS